MQVKKTSSSLILHTSKTTTRKTFRFIKMVSKKLGVQGCLAIFILLTAQLANAVEMEDMILVAEGQPTVTVTVTAPAVPTTVKDPSYIDSKIFKKEMLDVSNDYREQHSAKPLVWNETLAEYSKKWAETCDFVHSVSSLPLQDPT